MNFQVLVTDKVRQKGIGAMAEAPQVSERFGMVSLQEMLDGDWAADTHFVTYLLKDEEGEDCKQEDQFRLRKTIRSELEEAGAQIQSWGFVGDWDLNENVPEEMLHKAGWDGNPKKKPKISWTHDLIDKFEEELISIVEALRAKHLGPAYIYLTNHGARMIHLYDHDVDVIEHEQIIRGMIAEYENYGWTLDDACIDWTRLFRAPRVVRSGQNTWEQGWFKVWHYRDAWTVVSLAPKHAVTADDYATVPDYVGDRPTPEDAMALLAEDFGVGTKTEAYRSLKGLLHRRGCTKLHEILVGKDVMLREGSRDKELARLIGQLSSHVYAEEWSSPELTYAVMLPVAEQLDPDEQTGDWLEVTWSMCKRMWTKEAGKSKAKEEKKQEEAFERLTDIEELLVSLRKIYPKNEKLCGNDAIGEAQRMGLLVIGSNIFTLRPDGYYTPHSVPGSVLPGTIRDLGMSFLMQTAYVGPKGGVVKLDTKELLFEHGRGINKVIGSFGFPGAYLDGMQLMRPLFEWADHEPVMSEFVHIWLQKMAGREYQTLAKWIAYAQDLRRPICSLALVGASGVGKGLFAAGLSELIVGSPMPASGSDLVETFTPAMMESPFLVVNEGLPVNGRNVRDVADAFRSVVAGDPCRVNAKFQAPVEVRIPFRVLFTANNQEIIHGLVGQKTLTPEDRVALAERIKFIKLDDSAAVWLRQKGGRNFTSGWVAGDGPSNFVVARHFRWLYENREELFGPPDSDRFLVTGDLNSMVVDDLRVLSGVTPEVAKVCVYLIHTATHSDEVADSMHISEEGVWITTNAIIAYYNSTSTMDKKVRLNEKNVGISLSNLTSEMHRDRKETLRGNVRQLRWRKLDLAFLLQHAQNHGLPTERIITALEVSE